MERRRRRLQLRLRILRSCCWTPSIKRALATPSPRRCKRSKTTTAMAMIAKRDEKGLWRRKRRKRRRKRSARPLLLKRRKLKREKTSIGKNAKRKSGKNHLQRMTTMTGVHRCPAVLGRNHHRHVLLL